MEYKPPTKIKIVDLKNKGLGVVATDLITTGETIETCVVITVSKQEIEFINKSTVNVLKHYILELTAVNKHVLFLGYGMIYNHSFENDEPEYLVLN